MEKYVGSYTIEEIVLVNVIKLKLLASMRIHLVINVSRIVKYRKPVKEWKMEEVKMIKVNRVEKWEVDKILNKRKIREVVKYLI